jgi:hypothetical protein
MSFDTKCLELAEHFLPATASKEFKDDMAQAIQDAVENWRCPDDDHDWEYIRDWEGDPNVINGTHDISYKHCKVCYAEEAWDGENEPFCNGTNAEDCESLWLAMADERAGMDDDVARRMVRTHAIGNRQVPAVVAAAYRMLTP